ncbi:MAG: phosphoketolase family protein, partial [Ktedonobacterales bacterium]
MTTKETAAKGMAQDEHKGQGQNGQGVSYAFDTSLSSAVAVEGQPQPSREADVAMARGPLSADQLERMQRYWQAANYLTVGQIYLLDNPLLREPLRPEHIKPRLLGHWGTS